MNVQGNEVRAANQMPANQFYTNGQVANEYWNTPAPHATASPTPAPCPPPAVYAVNQASPGFAQGNAPTPPTMVAGVVQSPKPKESAFSKMFIAFVVIGLFLLGESISPLLVHFNLPSAYGVLAFDILLMACALACTAMGFSHSSQTMRYAGLAVAFCTIVKMVAVDPWDLDSLTRAIAYIVGAVSCVGIGVLYSRASKRANGNA